MLPLWIIDLGQEKTSAETLQKLLSALPEDHRAYWHYTCSQHPPITNMEECKSFMEEIIAEGRACNNDFIKAGFLRENFQVAILGSADESLSQSIFASLPGLLRDEFPKIVADHTHLGLDITGFLFIPNTINQEDDLQKRIKAALMLEEVNNMTNRLESSHFSRVVAYQDIQNNGNQFYPGLSTEKRTELLFQMLVSQYYCKDQGVSIFESLATGGGIFSLGAASVYYDSVQHCSLAINDLLKQLSETFKNESFFDKEYSKRQVLSLFNASSINTDTITTLLRSECSSVNVNLKKMDPQADPHPVWNLFCSDLFPLYYRKYLKYMPSRLIRFMQSLSYALQSRFSGILRKNRENLSNKFCTFLKNQYKPILKDEAAKKATIAQLESFFKEAQKHIASVKSTLTQSLTEVIPVPKYLKKDYELCLADEKGNSTTVIIEDLKKNLKKEPVVLSLLIRCILLGLLLVLFFIPLLRVISPIIHLRHIATVVKIFIPFIFFLPLFIHFFIKLRRHFKRIKRLKYKLLASVLLSVNKRLSKSLYDELVSFYNSLIQECESQLSRLDSLRKSIKVGPIKQKEGLLPNTYFNQSILDGEFCGEKLIIDNKSIEASIQVKEEKVRLSMLNEDALLLLLKQAFLVREVLDSADLSDDQPIESHADSFIMALDKFFMPKLNINTASDIGSLLLLLKQDANIVPLLKMSDLNGMLFSTPKSDAPLLRIKNTHSARLFGDIHVVSDETLPDYAFLVNSIKLENGLFAAAICNCQFNELPELSFADKLSLYYAFYRHKEMACSLAGIPVRIPKDEMENLNKQIIGG